MTCLGVHLASPSRTITMDGTADSDGIFWSWRTIDGWWEGGTPSMAVQGRAGADGSVLGSGLRRGRPVTLAGNAWVAPSTTEAAAKTAMLLARRKVNEAADLVHQSGTLTVDEDVSRFVAVYRNLRLEFTPQRSPYVLEFVAPLVCADWRKKTVALVSSAVSAAPTATNGGDAGAAPIVHIFGPTNPFPYLSIPSGASVSTTFSSGLSGGDEAVIDFEALTLTLNGSDATGSLDIISDFFDLPPGPTVVTLNNAGAGTIRVDHHNSWL